MVLMAVSPIARPMSMRRNSGFEMAWCTGEAGCSRIVPNVNAETMKRPRQVASIRYSGQWRFNASVMCRWMLGRQQTMHQESGVTLRIREPAFVLVISKERGVRLNREVQAREGIKSEVCDGELALE